MSRMGIITLSLILILLVVQTTALLGAKLISGAEVGDLLAPYVEIMPGQELAIFTPRWCAAYEETPQEQARVCTMEPDEGHFTSVNIYIRERIVQGVMFRVKDLALGDLPLDWGQPAIETRGNLHYARWERAGYAITVPLGDNSRLNYWQHIEYLSVEANQSSTDSCQQTECAGAGYRLSAGRDLQFAENFVDVPFDGADG